MAFKPGPQHSTRNSLDTCNFAKDVDHGHDTKLSKNAHFSEYKVRASIQQIFSLLS